MRKIILASVIVGAAALSAILLAFYRPTTQSSCPHRQVECCKKPANPPVETPLIWENVSRQFI
ncbi:MAG: hypothetical protein C4308_09195 [Chitinophagaceae bacterium]